MVRTQTGSGGIKVVRSKFTTALICSERQFQVQIESASCTDGRDMVDRQRTDYRIVSTHGFRIEMAHYRECFSPRMTPCPCNGPRMPRHEVTRTPTRVGNTVRFALLCCHDRQYLSRPPSKCVAASLRSHGEHAVVGGNLP